MFDISHLTQIYVKNRDFPRLISFPRTGSHWLRMVLELYLHKPCLTRSFFIPDPKECWGIHTHDREFLECDLGKVIYLFRNPVDTIFSELSYRKIGYAKHLVDLHIVEYFGHLDRWLNHNEDIDEILFVTYENIRDRPLADLEKVLDFLNAPFEEKRLVSCYKEITKEKAKSLTPHDPQAVNSQRNYEKFREQFKTGYADYILEAFESVLGGTL